MHIIIYTQIDLRINTGFEAIFRLFEYILYGFRDGIKVDYIVRENEVTNVPYSFGLFSPNIFGFGYKDMKDAIVWIAFPDSRKAKEKLESLGYQADETYYDCISEIYGDEIFCMGGV